MCIRFGHVDDGWECGIIGGMRHSRISMNGRSSPVGSTIFGLIFAGFAVFMMTLMGGADARDRTIGGWGTVPCVIEKSSVARKSDKYVLNVTFDYEVDGAGSFSSHCFRRDSNGYHFDSIADRAGLLERYAVGTRHECHVNPDNPGEAFLDSPANRRVIGSILAYLFPSVFIVIGLSIAFGPWISRARRKRREAQIDSQVETACGNFANSWGLGIFLIVFGSFFLIPVLACELLPALTHRYDSWLATDAVILHSEVVSHTSRNRGHTSTTYRPYIAYSYTVDGVDYENDRFSPIRTSDSDHDFHAAIVSRYPVGSHATIYYDPDDPSRSLVERKAQASLMTMLISGLFGLIGFGFVCAGIVTTVKRVRQLRLDSTAVMARDMGPRKLRRITIASCWANTVFALFWCALTSCHIAVIKPWKMSGFKFGNLPLLLFYAVFACVGLWLLAQAIIEWVRNFANPHLVLTLADGRAEAGRTVQVAYEIDGPADKVESFVVSLVPNSKRDGRSANLSEMGNPKGGMKVFKAEGGIVPPSGYFRFSMPFDDMDLFVRGKVRGHLEMRDRYRL